MPEAKDSSIVSALDGLTPPATNKVDMYFGGSPNVLDAIKRARKRRVAHSAIAKQLNQALPDDCTDSIGEGSVKAWLRKNGID